MKYNGINIQKNRMKPKNLLLIISVFLPSLLWGDEPLNVRWSLSVAPLPSSMLVKSVPAETAETKIDTQLIVTLYNDSSHVIRIPTVVLNDYFFYREIDGWIVCHWGWDVPVVDGYRAVLPESYLNIIDVRPKERASFFTTIRLTNRQLAEKKLKIILNASRAFAERYRVEELDEFTLVWRGQP